MKIVKYTLKTTDKQTLILPFVTFLSAKEQDSKICIWYLIDENQVSTERYDVYTIGTGIPMNLPHNALYLDTVVTVPNLDGEYTIKELEWHVFYARVL